MASRPHHAGDYTEPKTLVGKRVARQNRHVWLRRPHKRKRTRYRCGTAPPAPSLLTQGVVNTHQLCGSRFDSGPKQKRGCRGKPSRRVGRVWDWAISGRAGLPELQYAHPADQDTCALPASPKAAKPLCSPPPHHGYSGTPNSCDRLGPRPRDPAGTR